MLDNTSMSEVKRDYLTARITGVISAHNQGVHIPDEALEVLNEIKNFLNTPTIHFPECKFNWFDNVQKTSGSYWEGKVVGFYSTEQTKIGYCIQLPTKNNNGPVQIYPESALELIK